MSRLSNTMVFWRGEEAIPEAAERKEKKELPPVVDEERQEIHDRLRNIIGKIGDIHKVDM